MATRFATSDPIERPLEVATSAADEPTPAFGTDQLAEAAAYYAEQGYVVVRGVVPAEVCARANDAFDDEVKADRRSFYRLSGTPEPHRYTEAGFMLDGVRDVQSLDRRHHPEFRRASLDVVTHPGLSELIRVVLGEPGKVVQTMYFEGNPATQPHQDTYYLDAEELGRMVAAWVACEPIAPGAGRFYVCPGSHRLDLPRNAGEHNIAEHHERYVAAVADAMASVPLEVRAPALDTGDVLLWASGTIHGSLRTDQPERSRRSFTAHYIPDSSRFLQWQRRVVPLGLLTVGGIRVHHPKDLNRAVNRVRYAAETRFPGAMERMKHLVTSRMLRRP